MKLELMHRAVAQSWAEVVGAVCWNKWNSEGLNGTRSFSILQTFAGESLKKMLNMLGLL